ncbi:odorant receptor 67a-like [Tribolium madens]|uniref:odorant receptor 67a-like n=1 Tax=Tribolium madens TaxID=41895 RepID=UPI001CF74C29|nr:odorant receptor 67a-like [Tribolium madens]
MTSNQEDAICSKSCFFLRSSFLWPEETPTKSFYVKFILVLLLSLLTAFLPLLIHFLILLERGLDPSEDLFVIISYTGFTLIMTIYVINLRKMSYLIMQLSDFKKFGKPRGYDYWIKNFNLIASGVYYYVLSISFCLNLTRWVGIPECRKTRDFQVCGIVIPYWLPWKVDSWFFFILLDLYVLKMTLIVNCALFLIIFQILEITMHIKLRIDHLKEMLTKCFDNDSQTNEKQLVKCICYHNYIINCSNVFRQCFTYSMFSLIVAMAFSCGCLESQIVKFDLWAVPPTFAWICLLFTACMAGQILMIASLEIGDASYHSKWYQFDVTFRKCLILVMIRSQKALVLSAGPFNILCFSLFVAIMKFSYSVFLLLNQH